MKPIPERAPLERLEAELNEQTFVRTTNKNNNEIYVFDYHTAPYLTEEIGRLRELTFRNAGGGTGKELDLDKYDTCENPYKQLVVWDPELKQILGGYRFYTCNTAPKDENGNVVVATTKLFKFSDEFKANQLNQTIELGRSFVVPDFQATKSSRRGLFTLDNLWDGLGALMVDFTDMEYFIGKVTMYRDTPQRMRDLMYHFLEVYFPNKYRWAEPIKPFTINNTNPEYLSLFDKDSYQEGYKVLSREVRDLKANIPPLINAYMNLSPTMQTFGTVINDGFGAVEDTGILLKFDDIYGPKKDRHIKSYNPVNKVYTTL